MKRLTESGVKTHSGAAVFSGETMDFSGEVFKSAEVNAVFGGYKCDLRNAVLESDCVLQATAVFGGIDIFVPDHINVKVSSNSIFGGVSNKTSHCQNENAVTLYIKANCLFGGVEIK
ncbi:MAG: LiaF domain-containing protein [Faecousia sp.]